MTGVTTETLSRVAHRLSELGITEKTSSSFWMGATIGLFLTNPAKKYVVSSCVSFV